MSTAATTTTFHYVMTVHASEGRFATFSGTANLPTGPQGGTRAKAFEQIRAVVARDMGLCIDQLAVQFFSIEPNQL
ncbi:hypothetical protein [Streptomyces sp. NBC_01750]|uniref:hypothetical protein n=1 Tax=Streptomyces sp. NBC_01750 TaxID=2975928 RepID=UPI002DD7A4EA|nr:hypothetical protein [Streptomyces sp. NBC_01750]WSD33872.1 hypothetical protein OG966_19430 [Streptomyces sp. NBC_01750]